MHNRLNQKCVFISADHGLPVIYFLQSDVVPLLLKQGVKVVLLTDDDALDAIRQRFEQPGLIFEGLRLAQCNQYLEMCSPRIQFWLHILRWVGGSNRVNVNAINGNFGMTDTALTGHSRLILPFVKTLIWAMRNSRLIRNIVVNYQQRFNPHIYADLFEKYKPDLVIASTPGWRMDRYLLREAYERKVKSVTCIVGWDNPSSYRLSGAHVDYATCWSEIQKEELVKGADWDPDKVYISGIPSYDGYFNRSWLLSRKEYFRQHDLNPKRKLLAYACSFETFAPNFPNVKAIAELVNNDQLAAPCQLLIRLHPNHFRKGTRFEKEAEQIREYIKDMPYVHIVKPVSLGGGLGHYSGEDMPEKASMMAYADVFLTVYSTMVVETAIHDRPIVSVCIDVPGGWNIPGVYSLPLTTIGEWPTHQRFRQADAGRVANDQAGVQKLVNDYLLHPELDRENRIKFIQDECTYMDGSAGRRTGEYLYSLLENN